MAFSDLTFGFFTDSGLTTSFSNLYQLVHYTDLSDNPQDFTLYFGSPQATGTRVLKATSNPGVDNITLTPTQTINSWAGTTAYSSTSGDVVQPTVANTYRYVCTTSGTSGSSEPTWPTVVGGTVTDGTVVWTNAGKKHPNTEIKLALSSGGLSGATGGAALSLGTSITSGSTNAVAVYIRVTNTVTTAMDTTGHPDIKLYMNEVIETAV